LRKIQSFGDIVAINYSAVLDEPALGLINRMQSAAQQMSLLIRDLLDYSRVSTHRAPFGVVLLSDLLEKVINNLHPAIEQTGTTIEWSTLPAVYGIREQLHQLFQQLLSNAIKFRKPGVAPHVRLSYRTINANELPPTIVATMFYESVSSQPTHRFVYEINVTDNGIGFDEKYLDRIFQVFQRLHRKHEYEGTGVGLAICRKVIENHRGYLMATSQPEHGATFQIYLPVDGRT
jgi:light-regulated signal transduction histidine kinase (bacteriophytochrome)